MDDLILPRRREHPDWIKAGSVAVDSGTIEITDDSGGAPYLEVDANWASDGHSTRIKTLFGDGQYDVFVQTNDGGEVERVLIEFGTWDDE